MTSRPPSRINGEQNEFSQDNSKEAQMVALYLTSLNPRALTNDPPNQANIKFLQNLYKAIKTIELLRKNGDTVTDMIHTIDLQQRIIETIYNHIHFIYVKGWITQ
jgi:hypothetical protein